MTNESNGPRTTLWQEHLAKLPDLAVLQKALQQSEMDEKVQGMLLQQACGRIEENDFETFGVNDCVE